MIDLLLYSLNIHVQIIIMIIIVHDELFVSSSAYLLHWPGMPTSFPCGFREPPLLLSSSSRSSPPSYSSPLIGLTGYFHSLYRWLFILFASTFPIFAIFNWICYMFINVVEMDNIRGTNSKFSLVIIDRVSWWCSSFWLETITSLIGSPLSCVCRWSTMTSSHISLDWNLKTIIKVLLFYSLLLYCLSQC